MKQRATTTAVVRCKARVLRAQKDVDHRGSGYIKCRTDRTGEFWVTLPARVYVETLPFAHDMNPNRARRPEESVINHLIGKEVALRWVVRELHNGHSIYYTATIEGIIG